jgi:hypothetical protein
MVYIILITIILYVLYKPYKYLKDWWTGTGRPKALTAPTLEARASTGSGMLGNTLNNNIKTSNGGLVTSPEAIPLQGSAHPYKRKPILAGPSDPVQLNPISKDKCKNKLPFSLTGEVLYMLHGYLFGYIKYIFCVYSVRL